MFHMHKILLQWVIQFIFKFDIPSMQASCFTSFLTHTGITTHTWKCRVCILFMHLSEAYKRLHYGVTAKSQETDNHIRSHTVWLRQRLFLDIYCHPVVKNNVEGYYWQIYSNSAWFLPDRTFIVFTNNACLKVQYITTVTSSLFLWYRYKKCSSALGTCIYAPEEDNKVLCL